MRVSKGATASIPALLPPMPRPPSLTSEPALCLDNHWADLRDGVRGTEGTYHFISVCGGREETKSL